MQWKSCDGTFSIERPPFGPLREAYVQQWNNMAYYDVTSEVPTYIEMDKVSCTLFDYIHIPR